MSLILAKKEFQESIWCQIAGISYKEVSQGCTLKSIFMSGEALSYRTLLNMKLAQKDIMDVNT